MAFLATYIYLVAIIDRIESALMSGNPAFPLLSQLREQTEALERELSALKSAEEPEFLKSKIRANHTEHQAEIQAMQATLDAAMAEIKRLRSDAREREYHEADHAEKQHEILRYLSDGEFRTEEEVASRFGISAELTKYNLVELMRSDLVNTETILGRDYVRWKIAHEGRAFLAKRGQLG